MKNLNEVRIALKEAYRDARVSNEKEKQKLRTIIAFLKKAELYLINSPDVEFVLKMKAGLEARITRIDDVFYADFNTDSDKTQLSIPLKKNRAIYRSKAGRSKMNRQLTMLNFILNE